MQSGYITLRYVTSVPYVDDISTEQCCDDDAEPEPEPECRSVLHQ